MRRACLANGGDRHHWKYRNDPVFGRIRECQGCGTLEHRRDNGRYVSFGSTRWFPPTPAELERERTSRKPRPTT